MAIAVVAAVVLLSNRTGRMSNGMPVIESEVQYDDVLDRVTRLTPTAVGKFNTGQELDQSDRDAALEGAKSFDTMNAFRPDMAAGYYEAGLLYYLAGDSDRALERLNQSLVDAPLPSNLKMEGDKSKVDTIVGECHHMISRIAFDRHEYKLAVDEANTALTHTTTREGYYFARAQAEVQLNQIPAAKKDLASALKINPAYLPATRLNDFLKH